MKNQSFELSNRSYIYIFSLTSIFIILSYILAGCKKEPAYKDAVLITGTDVNNLLNFTVDGPGSSVALTATATGQVNQDITVSFKTDTTLLKNYNATNGTNFYPLPAGTYNLSGASAVIKAGGNVSDAIALKILSTDKLVSGRNYMVPVNIGVTKGNLNVLPSSSTAFIKINRVITTNVVDFNNGPYPSQVFSKSIPLSKFTFEFRVNVAQFASGFHISRVCDFSGDNDFNLIRFGELSDAINQLQWINSAGKVSSKTFFATNTWYTISCVFDGSTCTMYVNGVPDASFAASGQSFSMKQVQLGYPGQNLNGKISEYRLWSRALSPGEIQNGFCGVDPTTPGLVAYWKFNEGTGNIINDNSGHGYNIIASSDFNWVTGIKCPN